MGLDLVGDGGDNMWLDTVVVGVLAVGAHLVDIVGSGCSVEVVVMMKIRYDQFYFYCDCP